MEPLSLSLSIITIVKLAAEAVGYVNSVSGATQDRKGLRNEIRQCESLLTNIKDGIEDADEGQMWSERIKALGVKGGPLDVLAAALKLINAKLQPKKGLKKVYATLKWPFDLDEVGKIISIIERQKSLLQLALANDSRNLILEVKKSSIATEKQLKELKDMLESACDLQEAIQQYHVDEEAQKIISWLSPLDYWKVHEQNLNTRQEGTNKWILDNADFKNWIEGRTKVIWCHGIPGAGKSITASFVTSYLRSTRVKSRIGICIILFDYKLPHYTPVDSLLWSLAQQLLTYHYSLHKTLPSCVSEIYKPDRECPTRDDAAKIPRIMEALASLYDTVFIVVDALDEYNGDLQEIVVEKFRALPFRDMRLFCTSRFLPRISDIFKDEMAIKITAQDQDIGVFVKGHIQQRTRLKDQVKKNPSLESDIISVVTSKASGMFLLAKFHMDSLTTKNNPADIRKALQELPPTLELTYQSTINRILSQARDDRDLALKVLAWVAFALRPLRMKEMQHAIATTRDSLVDGIRENELTDEGTILMVCVGLVELVPNADPDGDICLGFVHNTTQEYIKRKLTKNSPPKNSPHVEVGLAATCITYLLCDSFKTGISPTDEEFDARLRQNPLYAYAAQNWGHHARTAPTELGPLILEFLKSEAKVCASNQAMMVSRTFMGYDKRVPKQITAIHLVAYFGLADIMAALLKGGCDVNIPDSLGRTPLWWAAASGWDLMVMTLLAKKGVKVNCKDEFGQTPLLRAAQNGHDSVVNLLLSKEADVDSEDENKQTPLSWAAQKGHGAVIKLLLSKGANVNSRDVYGQTPLPWAAENGHEVAVKLLLASGADANSRDEEGRTPLWWAVENRHERVIKQLLAAGVDANPKDRLGQTPLSWAARKGRSAGVKLLLAAEGVDADSMDYFGQTPLSWAAQKGHDGVVKLLLERKEVDPASKDSWGRTPLSWATEYGHGEVARLLVGRTESDGI